MINRWKQQTLAAFSDIFSGKQGLRESSSDQQIKELHAKIGELTG
jgi:transposase